MIEMAINTEKRLLEKIRIALANDIITPYELSVLLHYRSENQLYMLMNAINQLYSNDEIISIVEGNEKKLLLRK